MELVTDELYFSFFMGRLLGDHLKDALTQLQRERGEIKDALSRSEALLEQARMQLSSIRASEGLR